MPKIIPQHFGGLWRILFWCLVLVILSFVISRAFRTSTPELQTSVLRTSLSKLTSIPLEFGISEKGKLTIKAGPSGFLGESRVMALMLSSEKAAVQNTGSPFQVDQSLTTVFNSLNPENPQQVLLAIIFPKNHFSTEKKLIANLPFATSQAGEWTIEALFFGSLPAASFPPLQEFPLYVESSNIPFDENGAARLTGQITTGKKPPPVKPICSDKKDNDNDGKIDFPEDLGCTDGFDQDETDPAKPDQALQLDIPSQFINTVQDLDSKIETIVILPSAQEQLQYQFTFKAIGGTGKYQYGIKGKTPNLNEGYPLENSGLLLGTGGILSGAPNLIKAGNYRYPLFVTDGKDSFAFSLQMSVFDGFGNAVPIRIQTNFSGTEHRCFVGQVCEGFFKAEQGIEPYRYSFTGESPSKNPILQLSLGQAFYRFTPTEDQVGSYEMSVGARDSRLEKEEKKKEGSDEKEAPVQKPSPASAGIQFILVIKKSEPPKIEVPATFKGAAEDPAPKPEEEPEEEVLCEFLDVTPGDDHMPYFAFNCANGIMQGSAGAMRPKDPLNRAEAAKVTVLIGSTLEEAEEAFAPFTQKPESAIVNFQDVTVGDWYAPYVYYLFREGILANKPNYRPADTLTVAEALKLMIEAYAGLSEDVFEEIDTLSQHEDEWYVPYQSIAKFVKSSLGSTDPGRPVKREEIAETLYKLWKTYPVKKFE